MKIEINMEQYIKFWEQAVKDMQEEILKIAKELEQSKINETEAQNLLLGLFGVIKSVCGCNDLEYCNGVYKSCRKCGKLHSAWK